MALSEKIARSLLSLSPTASLNLYRLYYDTLSEPDSYFPFHPGTNGVGNPIIFGGISYSPIACEIDPIETNIQQRISRPRLRISNENMQISQLLRRKNEFKNAKIVLIKTLVKFLDKENFDSGENPYGIPDPNAEISRETFVVSQKTSETKVLVEFELTSPFDLDQFQVAGKTVLGSFCPFQYRGKGCNYCGPPVCLNDDTDFFVSFDGDYEISSSKNLWVVDSQYSAGQAVYVENFKNPPKTWFVCKRSHTSTLDNHPNKPNGSNFWEKDDCGKTITSCKKRHTDDQTNPCYKGYLPWGGYPGTNRYKFG
jgi:lambda family phage minor tail protein L